MCFEKRGWGPSWIRILLHNGLHALDRGLGFLLDVMTLDQCFGGSGCSLSLGFQVTSFSFGALDFKKGIQLVSRVWFGS